MSAKLDGVRKPSETYTHGHHASVLRSHRWRTAENSAGYLLPHLRSGLDLLDVGCGPGTISADLAAVVAPGRVVAIDTALAVIAQTPDVANVEFRVGDIRCLDADDATFDVVHAHQVLQHLAVPVAAIVEMRRLCRPGGVVAIRDGDYGAFTWYPAVPEIDRWLDLYRRAARANGGEPDAGRRLLSWAQQAGFERIEASASAWCFATPEDRTWWSDTWAERVTASQLAEQLVAGGMASRAELDDIAAGWRRWAAAEDAWFLVPHGEILAWR